MQLLFTLYAHFPRSVLAHFCGCMVLGSSHSSVLLLQMCVSKPIFLTHSRDSHSFAAKLVQHSPLFMSFEVFKAFLVHVLILVLKSRTGSDPVLTNWNWNRWFVPTKAKSIDPSLVSTPHSWVVVTLFFLVPKKNYSRICKGYVQQGVVWTSVVRLFEFYKSLITIYFYF